LAYTVLCMPHARQHSSELQGDPTNIFIFQCIISMQLLTIWRRFTKIFRLR